VRITPRSDWAWRQYSLALIEENRLEEADNALQNAKSLNPDNVWLWRHYTRLYKMRGDIRKEIDALEVIDRLGELDGNGLNQLGIAHHNQKNYAKALGYY